MLLSLVVILVGHTQGSTYFASRLNSVNGYCVSNDMAYKTMEIFPHYAGGVPSNLLGEKRWTDGWEIKNLTAVKDEDGALQLDYKTIVTDGSAKHVILKKPNKDEDEWKVLQFYVLANNVTFLLTASEDWRGSQGFKIYLDSAAASVEYCTELELPQQNCTKLATKEKQALAEGWTELTFFGSGASWSLSSARGNVLRWKNQASDFAPQYALARTHGGAGEFRLPLATLLVPDSGNTENILSRTFKNARDCLRISWDRVTPRFSERGELGLYSVTKSNGERHSNGALVPWRNGSIATMRMNLRGAGDNIRIELKDVIEAIEYIGLCPGVGDIEVLGPATGCTVFEEFVNSYAGRQTTALGSIPNSATLDNTIKVDLTEVQKLKVCEAMGFKASDSEKQVRYCNFKGCKVETCA